MTRSHQVVQEWGELPSRPLSGPGKGFVVSVLRNAFVLLLGTHALLAWPVCPGLAFVLKWL